MTANKDLLQTPLHATHCDLGGKIVPFAGWAMPVQYESIVAEHNAVRKSAGIFDISHMGQFVIEGVEAEKWLNGLLSNDVASLEPHQAHYTFLLNEEGGVIDDMILYRLGSERFFLVVNASCREKDLLWMESKLCRDGVALSDESERWAGMAVQGPMSSALFAKVFQGETLPNRNEITEFEKGGSSIFICRTGYTGEDGFELFCNPKTALKWFKIFIEVGAKPCGLGARDTLRLEMCYPLNGNDLSETHTPLEAGLGFAVKLDKCPFVGSEPLINQKKEGLSQKLVALQSSQKAPPPRAGYPLCNAEGEEIGTLTSGGLSPSLSLGIALAYVPFAESKVETAYQIDIRGRKFPMKIVKKPFYRP